MSCWSFGGVWSLSRRGSRMILPGIVNHCKPVPRTKRCNLDSWKISRNRCDRFETKKSSLHCFMSPTNPRLLRGGSQRFRSSQLHGLHSPLRLLEAAICSGSVWEKSGTELILRNSLYLDLSANTFECRHFKYLTSHTVWDQGSIAIVEIKDSSPHFFDWGIIQDKIAVGGETRGHVLERMRHYAVILILCRH